MSMPARKLQFDPQQERDEGLELLTTSDLFAAQSAPGPVRDRRVAAQDRRSVHEGRASRA
jgi:hypothetical protein